MDLVLVDCGVQMRVEDHRGAAWLDVLVLVVARGVVVVVVIRIARIRAPVVWVVGVVGITTRGVPTE